MLPCQNTCPHYTEGCHKTCADWKRYQALMQKDRQKRAAYLKMQEENCRVMIRQYRDMMSSRRYY